MFTRTSHIFVFIWVNFENLHVMKLCESRVCKGHYQISINIRCSISIQIFIGKDNFLMFTSYEETAF